MKAKTAEEWMKENYFEPSDGTWAKFDDYKTMEEYAEYYHQEKLKVDQEQSVQVKKEEFVKKVKDEEIKRAIKHLIVNYWNNETKATEEIYKLFRDQLKPVDPMKVLNHAIDKTVKFTNQEGLYTDTFSTECDGEENDEFLPNLKYKPTDPDNLWD